MDYTSLLVMGAMIVGFYFLLIRPQQKRAKDAAEMQKSLGVGDRIVTVHGIFGTIKHMGSKTAILEVSPGCELTIVVGAISRVAKPEDEEFEYSDDGDAEPTDFEVVETAEATQDLAAEATEDASVADQDAAADAPKGDSASSTK